MVARVLAVVIGVAAAPAPVAARDRLPVLDARTAIERFAKTEPREVVTVLRCHRLSPRAVRCAYHVDHVLIRATDPPQWGTLDSTAVARLHDGEVTVRDDFFTITQPPRGGKLTEARAKRAIIAWIAPTPAERAFVDACVRVDTRTLRCLWSLEQRDAPEWAVPQVGEVRATLIGHRVDIAPWGSIDWDWLTDAAR